MKASFRILRKFIYFLVSSFRVPCAWRLVSLSSQPKSGPIAAIAGQWGEIDYRGSGEHRVILLR